MKFGMYTQSRERLKMKSEMSVSGLVNLRANIEILTHHVLLACYIHNSAKV